MTVHTGNGKRLRLCARDGATGRTLLSFSLSLGLSRSLFLSLFCSLVPHVFPSLPYPCITLPSVYRSPSLSLSLSAVYTCIYAFSHSAPCAPSSTESYKIRRQTNAARNKYRWWNTLLALDRHSRDDSEIWRIRSRYLTRHKCRPLRRIYFIISLLLRRR